MCMNKYTCFTPSREAIIREYIEKPGASITTASVALGITRKVLWRCLKTYGLKAKSKGRKGIQRKNYVFDVDSFKAEYFKPGVTLSQYAQKLGVGTDTLRRVMRDNGISSKPKKGSYYKHETDILSRISLEDIEKSYFSIPKASLESAAKKLGIARNSLGKAIKQLGLEAKPRFRTGELHGNWNGGTSYNPLYPWSFKLIRAKIIEREKGKCMICQKQYGGVWRSKKRSLSIHHIDYDKCNSDKRNLVALCFPCHSKTNYKRDTWIPFFKSYIKSIYEV